MPTSGARPVLAFDSPQFVVHRRRFARLQYIVWGCAGYQGNCDIDYDLVSPVGFSNRQEARQCAAAMTAACEDHCDSSAEIINETPGLEWDGAESYYVATLTLPSALNWDGGDAFGALAADLLRRGVDASRTLTTSRVAGQHPTPETAQDETLAPPTLATPRRRRSATTAPKASPPSQLRALGRVRVAT